jgi:4-amino-4-deoxy-L-arabinose transferase-like glycosyltransferase
VVRALEDGRTRWLLLSAALVGLAFNTKDLQAYLVLPALVPTYLLFGPPGLRRRLLQLLAAGAVLTVSSGWWLVIVDATPAASRPYIGGSTDNSVLNLVLGYNGLGRIFGQGGPGGGGAAGGPGGPGGFGGQPGLLRMFNPQVGGQVSWLIPLALVALVGGIWVHRRRPRIDLGRAGYAMWGLWLLTHGLVFSFASGIFHAYYTVAMAPAVGALVGAGLLDLWALRRRSWLGGALLAAGIAITGWWGAQLLARTPDYVPGLGAVVVAVASAAAAALAVSSAVRLRGRLTARAPAVALAVGTAAVLLGPSAYALTTVGQAAAGGDPAAGPRLATRDFGPPAGEGGQFVPAGRAGPASVSADLVAYLEQNQGSATWLVAVPGANAAAPIELATGKPVMAMGGFIGSDPAPTAEQLAQLVRSGQLRFVLLGAGRPDRFAGAEGPPAGLGEAPGLAAGPSAPAGEGGPGQGTVQQGRNQWVQANCQAVSVAGASGLYDCDG